MFLFLLRTVSVDAIFQCLLGKLLERRAAEGQENSETSVYHCQQLIINRRYGITGKNTKILLKPIRRLLHIQYDRKVIVEQQHKLQLESLSGMRTHNGVSSRTG